MKPRIRKVAGFWRCTTPADQGIGATPELAYREYMAASIDRMEEEIRRDREREQRREQEYQQHMRSTWLQQYITATTWPRNNSSFGRNA